MGDIEHIFGPFPLSSCNDNHNNHNNGSGRRTRKRHQQEAVVAKAMRELQKMCCMTNLADAHEQLEKAKRDLLNLEKERQDEMHELEKERQDLLRIKSLREWVQSNDALHRKYSREVQLEEENIPNTNEMNIIENGRSDVIANLSSKSNGIDTYNIDQMIVKSSFLVFVEEYKNLECYNFTLIPKKEGSAVHRQVLPRSSEEVEASIRRDEGTDRVRIKLRSANTSGDEHRMVLYLSLPRSIDLDDINISYAPEGDNFLSIKVMTEKESWISTDTLKVSDPYALNELACRKCGHFLLSDDKSIQKVLPLPEGNWEEIAEYLMCYDESPLMYAASPKSGCVLEDYSTFVIRRDDLCDRLSMKEVSIEDLKESSKDFNIVRGERPWRDLKGGHKIICTCCDSIIGTTLAYGKDDNSVRLYKHCISFADENEYTSASWVASEMVRYAESQFTFTFAITVDGGPGDYGQVLLLRLISWDSMLDYLENSKKNSFVTLKKAVKVIFEERYEWRTKKVNKNQFNPFLKDTDSSSVDGDGDDPATLWNWGGVDLCCPLGGKSGIMNESSKSTASVRLRLTNEQWENLKNKLEEGSKYFPKSTSEGTVQLKLGANTKSKAKLSFITLQ